MSHSEIYGFVQPGFERVRDTFIENFRKRSEVGASFAVVIDNKPVVSLWGGYTNETKTTRWEEDTLCILFSTTKGISSIAFLLLINKGLIKLDAKISEYWPEFAQNGKENITIRQLLSHQAGLCATDDFLTKSILNDEQKLSKILARQKPLWTPGDYQGYHAWTIALYQNEILKRVDPKSRSLQQFFQEEVAQPLGLNIHIGLPKNYNKTKVADLIAFNTYDLLNGTIHFLPLLPFQDMAKHGMLFTKSLINLPFAINLKSFNNPDFRTYPLGSGNGYSSALDLAKLYNILANGGNKLNLKKSTLQSLEGMPTPPKISDKDIAIHVDVPFHMGFAKSCKYRKFGNSNRGVCSFGAGGSAVYADPDYKMSMAYVMNKMTAYVARDPRDEALKNSVYSCLQR
jgi:CubicO group peptidase (beta-lactamase class C family)